eukprot:175271_1
MGFDISSFEDTIINPLFPSHEIPVYVYYPSVAHNATLWPTIVFGHGFDCQSQWYSWLYRDLVPNGVIVAYVNSYARGPFNQTQFAIDQRYTLQWLNTVVNNNKSSPLYGSIDTTQSMAAGHSEGGGASILSAGSVYVDGLFHGKNRFNSVFVMAPCGQFSGDSVVDAAQRLSVPTFVFTATMDCICPPKESKRLYNAIPSSTCTILADVTNGTHCKWMNPSGPLASACHELEVGLCKVMRRNGSETILERHQIWFGVEYINLFLSATINDNSKQYFTEIAIDLKAAQRQGHMNDIQVADSCDTML